MSVAIRGDWLVSEGIAKRWKDADLDAAIRAYWTADKRDVYEPLNDTEARPETPFPYVVLEIAPADVTARSGTAEATDGTQEHYEDVEVQFTIHAKNTSSATWRTITKEIALLILAAFNPGTAKLGLTPDRHHCTIPIPGFAARKAHGDGDSEGARVVRYLLRLEGMYDMVADKA
jgi:hypothetical protein